MTRRAACFLASALAASPAAAQILHVQPPQPDRDFGHFTGDVLTATTVIASAPGTTLDPRSLPVPGPADGVTDVRCVASAQSALDSGIATTIRVTYQTFAAPEHVSAVEIPGYSLMFLQGGTRLPVHVPAFRFTVSPLRNDIQPVLDSTALRPDPPWPRQDIASPARLLAGGMIAVVAGIFLLLMDRGRLAWPRGKHHFSLAARAIGHMGDPANTRKALLVLHRAFDATAGRCVLAEDLPRFFEDHRQFAPLQSEAVTFFAASHKHFFNTGDGDAALDTPALARLAQALGRAERRG